LTVPAGVVFDSLPAISPITDVPVGVVSAFAPDPIALVLFVSSDFPY
jgi:hypothetical protein